MPSSSIQIPLPAGLDTAGASALAARLLEVRGRPLTLDASGVERVGALGLQVLLSARLTWTRDGETLDITDPSPAFLAALGLAGVELALKGSA
jgi:chemotaxis protein CheX